MTTYPHCLQCGRYWFKMTCEAFPEEGSIPLEIWAGGNFHEEPYPGDNGLQFITVDEWLKEQEAIEKEQDI